MAKMGFRPIKAAMANPVTNFGNECYCSRDTFQNYWVLLIIDILPLFISTSNNAIEGMALFDASLAGFHAGASFIKDLNFWIIALLSNDSSENCLVINGFNSFPSVETSLRYESLIV
jgi:hypothetical protein